MQCPNCNITFVLQADYADHVQQCRTSDPIDETLLARLNEAADRLNTEVGDVKSLRLKPRLNSAAYLRVSRSGQRLPHANTLPVL